MRGTLILRLVDITLLLLLSLMATASFTTPGPELPVTHELEEEGSLLLPMQVGIASDGSIHTGAGERITLDELKLLAEAWPGEIEFIADAKAPASRLLAIHAVMSTMKRQAAFQVRQIQRGSH